MVLILCLSFVFCLNQVCVSLNTFTSLNQQNKLSARKYIFITIETIEFFIENIIVVAPKNYQICLKLHGNYSKTSRFS